MTELHVTCEWRDQGWGNRKGQIVCVLRGKGRLQGRFKPKQHLHVDLFGKAPHEETSVERHLLDEGEVAEAEGVLWEMTNDDDQRVDSTDKLVFMYRVGGGGGHQLHVSNFRAEAVVEDDDGSSSSSSDSD